MLSDLTAAEVAGTLIVEPLVSSWLGGVWLADVPVVSGSVTWSIRREVPGSLDLTVPRVTPGADWLPTHPAHPLAHYGQVLHMSQRITLPVSRRTLVRRLGTFRITGWDDEGGTVRVSGVSMFRLIENARLTSASQSRADGTLASELRRLVPAEMGVIVGAGLTDRACPRMTWGESRIDAVRDIAHAWPARLRETVYGEVTVLPPLDETPTPVVTLTDGVGGTVVSAYSSGSEDGLYNGVIVRGQETDEEGRPLFQAEAWQGSGPLRDGGPFGRKPRFFSSPLINSQITAMTTARSILANAVRQALTLPVTCASDPRLEVDDAVEVITDEGRQRYWGYISGLTVPLTHEGDMRVDVEVA